MKTLSALGILMAAIAAFAADSGPIVIVSGGKVRGATLDKGSAVFKGFGLQFSTAARNQVPYLVAIRGGMSC